VFLTLGSAAKEEGKMKRMLKSMLGMAVLVALFVAPAHATVIDLTTANSFGGAAAAIGGDYLAYWVDQQTTGTGVIEPFLRVQANGEERGYNTDNDLHFDEKAGIWTHALLKNDIPVVNKNGKFYREFLLDINQNKGGDNEFLTLNQVQIFLTNVDPDDVSSVQEAAGANPFIVTFGGLTEIFRMSDNGNTDQIELNFVLNPGSGAGDMFLYVEDSLFAGAQTHVVFATHFGSPNGDHGTNDGFEEWAVVKRVNDVPEPSSLLLLGAGLSLFAVRYRKQR